MKLKYPSLSALAALAMIGTASAVTTISYSAYTATSSADTSWVSPTGSTSVKAVNFGSAADTSFGGVNWLTSNRDGGPWGGGTYNEAGPIDLILSAPNQGWANSYGSFYSGGPDLLTQGAWTGGYNANGVDYRLEVNGLTVGQAYLLQFVFADNREGSSGASILINNYSANISANGDTAAYQYAYTDGKFLVMTASFTANESNFEFRPSTGGGLQINGIQVLAVPEPSAALLGGLGMLCLLRRRR